MRGLRIWIGEHRSRPANTLTQAKKKVTQCTALAMCMVCPDHLHRLREWRDLTHSPTDKWSLQKQKPPHRRGFFESKIAKSQNGMSSSAKSSIGAGCCAGA